MIFKLRFVAFTYGRIFAHWTFLQIRSDGGLIKVDKPQPYKHIKQW